jgi:SAM-dependent methyltransferase
MSSISKTVYKTGKTVRRGARDALEHLYWRANLWRYYHGTRKKLSVSDKQFDAYIYEQLEHTLSKKRLLGRRKITEFPFISIVAEVVGLDGKRILCVGARNEDEINCFRSAGAGQVIGIDLYSDHPDILVMDMHDLEFSDHSFDLVYSRHSFEHAYDKKKAAKEFVRTARPGAVVAIEVPAKYKGGADINVFESLDDLKAPFDGMIEEVLFESHSEKGESARDMGILRLIMRVRSS